MKTGSVSKRFGAKLGDAMQAEYY